MASPSTSAAEEAAERVAASKAGLEASLARRKAELAERAARRKALEQALAGATSDEERARLVRESRDREVALARESRRRYGKDDFEVLAVIGRGAFGEVSLVRPRAPTEWGKVYALKAMRKDAMLAKGQAAHVRAERDAMARADNPWVVHLHASFQDADRLYLLMEYAAGGDLMTLLIKEDVLPEEAVKFYAAQAVQAVASIHALGYIHRDLKPDNFLLDALGHVLLTDLGLCKKVDEGMSAAALESGPVAIGAMDVGMGGEGAGSSPSGSPPTVSNGGASPPHPPEGTAHEHTGLKVERQRAAAVGVGGTTTSSSIGAPSRRTLAFSTVGTPDYIAPEVLIKKGRAGGHMPKDSALEDKPQVARRQDQAPITRVPRFPAEAAAERGGPPRP